MAGTWVTDNTPLKLLDTEDATTATNGTSFSAAALYKGKTYRARLTMAAVTGTNPTLVVELQGSDSSTHASGVVSYGAFGTMVAADANLIKYMTFVPQHAYIRAVYYVGGTSTPTFNDVTVTVEEQHYRQRVADTSA